MKALGMALAAWALSFVMEPANAEPQRFEIDSDHFSVGFLVDHIGYAQQLGQFLEGQGEFVYDPDADELISGEVRVQADSVFTNHRRRDGHLRNDDFLDARRFDEIRFVATEWAPESQTLAGELTLLGQTRPVEFQATVNKLDNYPFGHEQPTLGVSVRGTIERSQWGMTYGVDQGMVGDEVTLLIELEAIQD